MNWPRSNVPLIAKIISVIFFIFALVNILYILFSIVISFIHLNIAKLFVTVFSSIWLIAILYFPLILFSIGLWKGKRWARILGIIIFLIAAFIFFLGYGLSGAASVPPTKVDIVFIFTMIVLCLVIAGYLTFSKSLKEAISKNKPILLQPNK